MSVIGTNISSLRAANASSNANSALATAMERLSTGKRINSAKDDAAGLAIASRMNSQVKSMAVAVRNANDGISMAQTAEGALGEVTSMLQRMKELATQSATGTLGNSERKALQAETDQLTAQINDIAKTTNFNGQSLLDGSVKGLKLQTGTNSGDTVSVDIGAISSAKLGLTGSTGGITSGRVAIADPTAIAAGGITLNGVNAFAGTGNTPITSAVDLANAVNSNSDRTGVVATASNNVTTKVLTGSVPAGALTIGGKAVASAASAEDLVTNINNNNYGVTATLNDDKSITLSNDTGANIDLTGSTSAAVEAGKAIVTSGFVSLQSKDGSNVTVGGVELADAGLNKSDGVSFTGGTAALTVGLGTDLSLNGVQITADSAADTAAKLATAINKQTGDTGVTATAVDVNGVANPAGTFIKLEATNGSSIRVEGAGATTIGFNAQGGTNSTAPKLDISTQSGASAAMAKIDKALDQISATRGNLGAIQNRLEVTVTNLTTTSTNLSDAKSRIEDADFSAETTALAKAQILSQASTAMLAQANQSQQGVLKLLQ